MPLPFTRPRPQVAALVILTLATSPRVAHALDVRVGGASVDPSRRVPIVADLDDDDDDGRLDAQQEQAIPADDLLTCTVRSAEAATIRVEGPLRIVVSGRAIGAEHALAASPNDQEFQLQATAGPTLGLLTVTTRSATWSAPLAVVRAGFLDAQNRLLNPANDALGVSLAIANDGTLPRGNGYASTSPDPANVRASFEFPESASAPPTGSVVTITATAAAGGSPRHALLLALTPPEPSVPPALHSPWIRLVADEVDLGAPGVNGRLLRVALRDRVRATATWQGRTLSTDIRVALPGDAADARAALVGRLRVRIVRIRPGGTPAVGGDERGAMRIGRQQVQIANEIWLQCNTTFGPPEEADVAVVDPPPPALLAIANESGLPAAGAGEIRFRVNGRPIGPITTREGDTPLDTALRVAAELESNGLRPRVTDNPRVDFAAGRSADVLVRDATGALVTLSPDESQPIGTDRRQTVAIGAVNLGDGLDDFDNMTASAGTLEERTLLKSILDDDPTTLEIVVISSFTSGTRQGEAFIASDGGMLVNAVILDRNGVRQQRHAWTQSHEMGHVLLDMPYHPDNLGPDRPWLLMDSDSSMGTVTGPKRLTTEECARMLAHSGPAAECPLLAPHDARSSRSAETGSTPPAPATEPRRRRRAHR